MTSMSFCVFVSVVLVSGLPIAAGQEKEPSGKVPYDRVCRVCHGPDGKGDAAPGLVPFTMEIDELMIRVREGGGEMPSISSQRVTDDEVKQIAEYLRSLSAAGDSGPAGLPPAGSQELRGCLSAARAKNEAAVTLPAEK